MRTHCHINIFLFVNTAMKKLDAFLFGHTVLYTVFSFDYFFFVAYFL